jgi:hypothetical protein
MNGLRKCGIYRKDIGRRVEKRKGGERERERERKRKKQDYISRSI